MTTNVQHHHQGSVTPGRVATTATLALLGAVIIPASPSQASLPTASGIIYTDYNTANMQDSDMYVAHNESGVLTTDAVFRTGSGTGTTDTCNKWTGDGDPNGAGPAPVGIYDMNSAPYHSDGYNGNLIYGRVWRFEDKACPNGTGRTEIFIHSEETPSATQGSVESQRWDGVNDYKSHACWKVARADNGGDDAVSRLDSWWHKQGGTTNHAYSSEHYVYWDLP